MEKQTQLLAFIEYEAANSFGTPIRGLVKCTYVDRNPEDFTPTRDKRDVMIDGRTTFDWNMGF